MFGYYQATGMVDRLMSAITVHQSLHGYSDGHRLISSSIQLELLDARAMLVMSDLSGPGVRPSTNGYLTGYPLEKSGMYVFARTWAAPEMPRPGCVWTHSLIIQNADLARLMSAQGLLEAFSRPIDMPFQAPLYREPLSLSALGKGDRIDQVQQVESLLHALYMCPEKQIVLEVGDALEGEQIATAIWMQQWPRLRRSFGFCTLSGVDRSKKGVTLDIQFARDSEPQLRSKFPGAVVVEQRSIPDALRPLLADLVEPASSMLREFLRRVGGDVDGGRRAMLPLCDLYVSLLESHPPDLPAAVSALAALDGDGRRQARSIRSLVVQQALKAPGQIDNVVFEFLLETLSQSGGVAEQVDISDKLGIELWRRSPRRFFSVLVANGPLSKAASHALANMKVEQIVSGLKSSVDIAVDIADRRPDILMHEDFWRLSEVDDKLVERISDQDAGLAAHALLIAGRIGPAENIISRADPATLVLALESDKPCLDTIQGWLEVLCRDQNRTAAVLTSGRVARMATIVAVARRIHPDYVPNEYGEDPWLVALRSASGTLNLLDEDFLAAFLLARALGWKSRSQAELLQYSYSRVYEAFQERRFSRETALLACARVDWGIWLTWDHSSRLRETVTRKFVRRNLNPEIFGLLVDEPLLAFDLIDEAARTMEGRKYLKQVRQAIKGFKEKRIKARVDYITKKLSLE